MKKNEDFVHFLHLPTNFSIADFDEHIVEFLKSKLDKRHALLDLDRAIGDLYNYVLLLSLHLKQKYVLGNSKAEPVDEQLEFTKQEVARKFRVSKRTVNNWIYEGLKTTEIGGVIRINQAAIDEFVKNHKTKKFNWPSVGNRPFKKAS